GHNGVVRDSVWGDSLAHDGVVRDVRRDRIMLARVDLAGIRGTDIGNLRIGVPGFGAACVRRV
ncbi:MAG: hypothetical protein WB973_00690, partial [Thermoanaerobaculia bacterium]